MLFRSALVYLFSNDGLGPDGTPASITGWALLLTILLSEHLFFLFRWGVRVVISKFDSPGLQKERRERYMVRKRYFEENLSNLQKAPRMQEKGDEITRESLEDDARTASLRNASVEEKFWARQRGWREVAVVGRSFIERAKNETAGVETKKEL